MHVPKTRVLGHFRFRLAPKIGNELQHLKNTLEYFNLCLKKIHNETVFVFDDIHWSEEMEEAWNEIKNHSKVRVSVDLFRMGLIFFRKELSYENYVIKF